MTRAQQNALILDSITTDLKDKPNVQVIITSKFNAWFKELVAQGAEMIAATQIPVGGGGEAAGGTEEGAAAPEGAPA